MTAPTWLGGEDDDLSPAPHEHDLYVDRWTGRVGCRCCPLEVERPDDMPDYGRVGFRRW